MILFYDIMPPDFRKILGLIKNYKSKLVYLLKVQRLLVFGCSNGQILLILLIAIKKGLKQISDD